MRVLKYICACVYICLCLGECRSIYVYVGECGSIYVYVGVCVSVLYVCLLHIYERAMLYSVHMRDTMCIETRKCSCLP